MTPIEPLPCRWVLPRPTRPLVGDVVGVGADLEPGTLLAGYRSGLFPMRVDGLAGPLGWWSPDPRGVLPLPRLKVSRSLRRSVERAAVTVDTAFDDVVAGCASPDREGAWIGADFAAAYGELHRLGWAHSVEVWSRDGDLAGGLYGVAVGGLFAGESMFHRETDASKVALVHLVRLLATDEPERRLLDVQWLTPHLATLGAVQVPRRRYLRLLRQALTLPRPVALDRPDAASPVSAASP